MGFAGLSGISTPPIWDIAEGPARAGPCREVVPTGRIIAFYNIEPEGPLQVFPHERLPVPFLESGGHINVLEWQELTTDVFYTFPEIIRDYMSTLCRCKWLTRGEYDGPRIQWIGESCIISGFGFIDGPSAAVRHAIELWELFVSKSYIFAAVQFLHLPWDGNPPLLQEIWIKKEVPDERSEIEEVLERTIENPTLLSPVEREILRGILREFDYRFPRFVEFSKHFDQFFAYGAITLNLKHPITQALLRFGASLRLSKVRKTTPEDHIGHLQDAITEFVGEFYRRDSSDSLRRLWLLAQETQLFDVGEIGNLVLTPEDFVPGTFVSDLREFEMPMRRVHGLPFGNVIRD